MGFINAKKSSPYFSLGTKQVGNSCLNWKSCPRHGRLRHPPHTTDLQAEVGNRCVLGAEKGLVAAPLPPEGVTCTLWHIQGFGSARDRVASASQGALLPDSIHSSLGKCFRKVNNRVQAPKVWKNKCGH